MDPKNNSHYLNEVILSVIFHVIFAKAHIFVFFTQSLLCLQVLQVDTCTIQFLKMNVAPLVSKPYVNGVILRGQNLSFKCCKYSEQKLGYQKGQDLSKEVL